MSRRRRLLAALLVFAAGGMLGVWLWQQREPIIQARVVSGVVSAAGLEGFERAQAGQPLSFPADLGPHLDYQTEWWYYTGNLQAPSGERFGYQFTIFRRATVPPSLRQERASDWTADQIYMAHFALTDVDGRRHHAFERFARGGAGLAGAQAEPYQVWLEDWQVTEVEPGVYRMQAAAGDVAIDLQMTDLKGPVLHGDQGYSRKGSDPGNASYYYSQTRLATEGAVRSAGQLYRVSGLSWKDHEYSTNALAPDQIGWDWFALQLDDGTELKVFHIRRSDGSVDPYSAGSIVDEAGNLQPLAREEFQIQVLDTWRSPHTGGEYPSRWLVTVPSLDVELSVQPHLADQELQVSYNYWEGAVRVMGQRQGRPVEGHGYVELTGYAGSMQGQF